MVRIVSLFSLCLWAVMTQAADWTQFRGPAGDGHADQAVLPTRWSETENLAWKTLLPGRGWSSPVVENSLIWVTTAVEQQATPEEVEAYRVAQKKAGNGVAGQMQLVQAIDLKLLAIDSKTGKIVHTIDLFQVKAPEGIHSLNSFASPTCILHEGRIFCHFGTNGTASVNTLSQEILWKTQIPLEHGVGAGSSPVLVQNHLVIPCDGMNEQFVIALDIETGKPVWKTPRPPLVGSKGDMHKAFSTPLVIEDGGETQVVIIGAQWAVSYHPLTGQEFWRVRHGMGFSNVPRPVHGHGLVYLCTGYGRPELWAVNYHGRGDITDTHVVWKINRQVSAMPSPVLVEDRLYFIHDQGVMTCVNALTGEQLWQKRVPGNYSASILASGEHLYVSNREGQTTVLKADSEFTEVAVNQLDGSHMASPAVIGNDLLLRTESHLYRIHQDR